MKKAALYLLVFAFVFWIGRIFILPAIGFAIVFLLLDIFVFNKKKN